MREMKSNKFDRIPVSGSCYLITVAMHTLNIRMQTAVIPPYYLIQAFEHFWAIHFRIINYRDIVIYLW